MRNLTASLSLFLVLSGCAGGFSLRPAPQAPESPVSVVHAPDEDVLRPAPRPGAQATATSPLTPQGRTADALDTTSASERAAATRPPAGGRALGESLAGLGAPGEGGFWLRTGLVSDTRAGRVVSAGGSSVAVELRPSGREAGSGSQISLAALRALGLSLTQLAPLTVYALD